MRFRLSYAALALLIAACGELSTPGPQSSAPVTGTMTDVEGNVYPTVQIARQEWMAANLKTTTYNDGTPIPLVTEPAAWADLTSDAYCWYDNDPSNREVYGALYNWYVIKTRKLCPPDWEVASSHNFSALSDALGGKSVAGGKLKEAGTQHWLSPNTGATDQSLFSALPNGSRHMAGSFVELGERATWWGYDQDYSELIWLSTEAYYMDIFYNRASTMVSTSPVTFGYAVRCRKTLP
jgi:uncharacterized protein (TIGR02145 family)